MNLPKKKKNINEQTESIDHEQYVSLESEERELWVTVKAKYEKIPLWSKISLIICAISVVLFVFICFNQDFADFFNTHISGAFRFLLAKISDPLPFSFAESLIILTPVILFIAIWYMWKYRCNTSKSTVVSIVCIVSVASMFLSSFILLFSAGYRGSELSEKLELHESEVDKYDLYSTAEYLVEEINKITPEVYFADDGFSKMPYSFSEMNKKLLYVEVSETPKNGGNQIIMFMSNKIDIVMTKEYLTHILKLPLDFFTSRKTGEILSRLNDATTIRNLLSSTFVTIIIDVFMFLFGGIFMFSCGSNLILVAMLPVLISAIVSWIFIKPYKKRLKEKARIEAEKHSQIVEGINNITAIKSLSNPISLKLSLGTKLKSANFKSSSVTLYFSFINSIIFSFLLLPILTINFSYFNSFISFLPLRCGNKLVIVKS